MIKLYNCDCIKVLDSMIKNNEVVDYIFTSPPYNRKRNDKYNNYNDTKDQYFDFLCDITDKCLLSSKYLFLNLQKNFYNKIDIFKFIGKYNDKIIDIVVWFLENFTSPGDIIFDPFMGVGTTGIVCKDLKRDFIGCEIDKTYFDICKERIYE